LLDTVTAHVEDVVEAATLVAGGRARPDVGPLSMTPATIPRTTDTITERIAR